MSPALLHGLEIHLGLGLREDARRLGHTEATARVLLAVGEGEALPMGEMARRLGRDPSTATRFVDRAAAAGLVARRPGREDRRRRRVGLTPAGSEARAALLHRRSERAEALGEAVLASTGLGTGQVEWFLQALADALEIHRT